MKSHWGLNITGALLLTISLSCQKEPSFEDTLVYGHAGTSLYPERWVFPANTRESILYGLDVLEAEGVEVDVQMTKDSVLVLYHDAYLDENTRLSGCIPHYDLAELADLDLYNTKYDLATLEEVLKLCFERNKKIYLDLKPFNFCVGSDVNHQTFNRSFNKLLETYSTQQKSAIVVNSRNADLLLALTDTCIVKSFETENIALAIEKFQAGEIEEVGVKVYAITASSASQMRAAGLNFTIFDIKTSEEIRTALALSPLRLITDNIAYTHKQTR